MIHVLDENISRLIAAGEVIERPLCVVRELLDNSLDAKASEIVIHLEQGGHDLIKIWDNGCGMSYDDLLLSTHPHATSKIFNSSDLNCIQTLGFRGEALSSISICSRFKITSSLKNTLETYELICEEGKNLSCNKVSFQEGTSIEVRDLFYSYPARKRFLKNPSTEARLVSDIIKEKALSFYNVSFRFYHDNELRFFYPKASSLEQRIDDIYESHYKNLTKIKGENLNFSLYFYKNNYRKDRRNIFIFVNNRKIEDKFLTDIIVKNFSFFIPEKQYPFVFLYLNIDYNFVDFNIHPHKKEVKIENIIQIHNILEEEIYAYLENQNKKEKNTNKVTKEIYEQMHEDKVEGKVEEKEEQEEKITQDFENNQFMPSLLKKYSNNSVKVEKKEVQKIEINKDLNINKDIKNTQKSTNVHINTAIDKNLKGQDLAKAKQEMNNLISYNQKENGIEFIAKIENSYYLLYKDHKKLFIVNSLPYLKKYFKNYLLGEKNILNVYYQFKAVIIEEYRDFLAKLGFSIFKEKEDQYILKSIAYKYQGLENKLIEIFQNLEKIDKEEILLEHLINLKIHNLSFFTEKLAIDLLKLIKNNHEIIILDKKNIEKILTKIEFNFTT